MKAEKAKKRKFSPPPTFRSYLTFQYNFWLMYCKQISSIYPFQIDWQTLVITSCKTHLWKRPNLEHHVRRSLFSRAPPSWFCHHQHCLLVPTFLALGNHLPLDSRTLPISTNTNLILRNTANLNSRNIRISGQPHIAHFWTGRALQQSYLPKNIKNYLGQ